MKTFEIMKKNRKYFAAKIDSKIPCKILIDANSESLELGIQNLEVDDISVRSKYGTDLIYKLSAPAAEIASAGITTLKTHFYNKQLVDECHKLGGKWDADERAWVFSGIVADKVEELDEKYNSTLISVEITFNEELYGYREAAYLAGFKIAGATGRDSGARLAEGVALIDGRVDSSGSMKNWYTKVHQNTKIRMEVPEALLQDLFLHDVTVVRLDTGAVIAKELDQNNEEMDITDDVTEDKKIIDLAIEKIGKDSVLSLLDANLGFANKDVAQRTIEKGIFFDEYYRAVIKKVIEN